MFRVPRKKHSERFKTFPLKAKGFPFGDKEIQEEVKASGGSVTNVYIVLDTSIWISFLMGQTFDERAGRRRAKDHQPDFSIFPARV
jgi:hypothetical protein